MTSLIPSAAQACTKRVSLRISQFSVKPVGASSNQPRFRRTRLVLLGIAGLFLTLLVEPHILRFVVERTLVYQASRHGSSLSIQSVEGSIFEPLIFHDLQ